MKTLKEFLEDGGNILDLDNLIFFLCRGCFFKWVPFKVDIKRDAFYDYGAGFTTDYDLSDESPYSNVRINVLSKIDLLSRTVRYDDEVEIYHSRKGYRAEMKNIYVNVSDDDIKSIVQERYIKYGQTGELSVNSLPRKYYSDGMLDAMVIREQEGALEKLKQKQKRIRDLKNELKQLESEE